MADDAPPTKSLPETAEELPPPVTEKEAPPSPPAAAAKSEPEDSEPVKTSTTMGELIESEKTPVNEPPSKLLPENLVSFKEESNIVGDLSEIEKKSLEDLKHLVRDALTKHEFSSPPPPPPATAKSEEAKPADATVKEGETPSPAPATIVENPETETSIAKSEIPKETAPIVETAGDKTESTVLPEAISIWGVPLMEDDRSDVILLKFLRARDFKVKDSFVMLKNTIRWRKEFKIDDLIEEDLGDDLEKVVFMHNFDREGHPVCYNVYGEFQNKELYQKTFGDEEKRRKFLRWRTQFLERSIRKLDFSPGGISTIFQVSDLKNSPGPAKRELRIATSQALQLLQDNYPEFVTKQVLINVPWWYLAFYTMISPFMTQRTKSKFVFAGPSKTADTLFKYITPEQVPIQYGGLCVDSCDCNPEFSVDDPATEITIKPATKQTVEILVNEVCIIVWELRVLGWEVSYSAEYAPTAGDGYTVIIQKATKMAPTDEPVLCNSFKVTEIGKISITIDNPTSKKKKLLYRFNVKPLSE